MVLRGHSVSNLEIGSARKVHQTGLHRHGIETESDRPRHDAQQTRAGAGHWTAPDRQNTETGSAQVRPRQISARTDRIEINTGQ
eukprot:882488-Pyramimonas_sp.AAC.1